MKRAKIPPPFTSNPQHAKLRMDQGSQSLGHKPLSSKLVNVSRTHNLRLMNPALVTVWFDGACPLCLREIALMRRLDKRGAIAFIDVTSEGAACPIDPALLLARFHAREGQGPLLHGAAAFVARHSALAPAW